MHTVKGINLPTKAFLITILPPSHLPKKITLNAFLNSKTRSHLPYYRLLKLSIPCERFMDLKLTSSHSVINEASPPDLTYLVKKYNLVSNTVTIYMAKKIKLIVVTAFVVINSYNWGLLNFELAKGSEALFFIRIFIRTVSLKLTQILRTCWERTQAGTKR